VEGADFDGWVVVPFGRVPDMSYQLVASLPLAALGSRALTAHGELRSDTPTLHLLESCDCG